MMRETWVIWDLERGRRYLGCGWPPEADARKALAEMLRGYPMGSEWRERVCIVQKF
jgi:hypothetical protein